MLKDKRLMQIYNMIKENGEVEISSLCRIFNVTEMTARRDLDHLAKEGKVIRTRGGAMLDDQRMLIETSFERRFVSYMEQKTDIAKKALDYIEDNNTVFIDSGTTGYILAQNIPNTLRITVLTNAVNIAAELVGRSYVSVIVIGGELRKKTLSCRGTVAEETMERFKVDIAFIGTNAVGLDGDMYIGSVTESGFKKKVMESAAKKIVLADSSKLDKLSLCRYANARDVDCLITDGGIEPRVYEALTSSGANIVVAGHQK